METLPLALPAAAAGLAYLNGRFAVSYDWALLSSYVESQVGGVVRQYKDNLNLFYELEAHAQSSRANHPFVKYNGRSWTYSEVYGMSLKYGTWFNSKGVQKDEVVAMDFTNSEVFIWVWFGLWSIGAKPAFINYNLTGKPLLHTIKTSTARLVVVDQESRHKFSDEVMVEHGFAPKKQVESGSQEKQANFEYLEAMSTGNPTKEFSGSTAGVEPSKTLEIVFFDQALEAHIESNIQGIRKPNEARSDQKLPDMAMLIYTSGTTGLPKPAVFSWGKANLGARFLTGWLPLKKSDNVYTCMPLYHSAASIVAVCATLHGGSTITIGKRFSHKTFWPEVRASNATIIHYVGEACRYLLSAPPSPEDKNHNIRLAYGNGLRPDVWGPFKERFGIPTICEFYSATESPSGMFNRSTNSFSAGAIGRNGTLATLLVGPSLTVVKIDQDSEPPVPVRDPTTGLCMIADWNEPGELMYKLDPANVEKKFQGYFGNDKATNSKVIRNVKAKGDAYFRSGDILRWDKEGRWWFVDRIGDTFRWKAENVSTAEVSEALGKHDAVEEANVYGVLVPNHDGRAGCAAVVLKDKALLPPSPSTSSARFPGLSPQPSKETLRSVAQHLINSLPKFAVPIFLRVTRSMHTTGTNKHQKHIFQTEGIDVERVERAGDGLYWLREGVYERFTGRDLERIRGNEVKL
ncbi:acetyl-CoA synthetase-like protein [Delitschia confertaspora ATCC 74209]|uniref:Acetyl-CoA synthetase-like protein n=1 Tax=Delitschia confertaspora ATCC 74209 TaxID=1513339 RepID=A0A9P4K0L0_9PLEO|nr:acetyl-CoA synthetase-like protein [Delitschia confertaspora ATCC 74209]